MRETDAALTLQGIRHDAVAITGISCRFPGADTAQQFWRNLVGGIESITRVPQQGTGGGHEATAARALLADVEQFDAHFFRFTQRQADIADPQLRLALECAWLALDSANCANTAPDSLVGVFMGASLSTYLLGQILPIYPSLAQAVGASQILFTNDKDFYPTTISHRLDLKGPSVNISTACSTGLVAVHSACQALATYQCDIALAGASSVLLPQQPPAYEPGGIYARDGHCRAFDADAGGTVGGSGCGFVVLKRIEDALRDRDFIHAVILGGAVNNDGSHKVSFAAPSASGQRTVIEQALANAGVDATDISLVEGHGTGTLLGDAVELEALTDVFADPAIAAGSCALGSVKTNIGHLDTAAGMAGLIKAALALQHAMIPPSLHFRRPDPQGALEGSAFYVPTTASAWPHGPQPRRAGVSAFGIGGTNVHLILQEPPPAARCDASTRPFHIVAVSAPSAAGCVANARQLAAYLREAGDVDIADVAFTLGACRKAFDHRHAYVARDRTHLLELIDTGAGSSAEPAPHLRVAFVFPQPGADDFGVMKAAYAHEASVRADVRLCADAARQCAGSESVDLCAAFVQEALPQQATLRAAVLFAGQYAMARLWMRWGVLPQAVAGNGAGAGVAACVAGALTLSEAVAALYSGTTPQPVRQAHPDIVLLDTTEIVDAADAAKSASSPLVSGRDHVALCFSAQADGAGHTSWAAHLHAWQPADGAATTAQRLYEGLGTAWVNRLPLDWAAFHGEQARRKLPIPSLPFVRSRHWLEAPETLTAAQVQKQEQEQPVVQAAHEASADPGDWCYVPTWKRCLAPPAAPVPQAPKRWLLLTAEDRFCAEFATRIRQRGHDVIEVFAGPGFEPLAATRASIDPRSPGDYAALLADLSRQDRLPDRIVHLWSLPDPADAEPLSARLSAGLGRGLHALLSLAQALGKAGVTQPIRLTCVYSRVHDVGGEHAPQPDKAALTAALKVIPQEYPNLSCLGVDVIAPNPGSVVEDRLLDRLLAECENQPVDVVCAYRGDTRWVQAFEAVHLPVPAVPKPRLRHGGVYLITGGYGSVGLALAAYLARNVPCDIALLGRSAFAPEDRWQALASGAEAADPEQAHLASALLALRAQGCRVRLYQADVADRDALVRAIAAIEDDFGAIDGVIHAAGVADTAGIIQNRSQDGTERALWAKVRGAVHLDDILHGRALDFFVLCSSIGSVLHALKFGEIGYVAANDFLDAFAAYRHAHARGLTVSINWTDWLDAGMSARAKARFAQRQRHAEPAALPAPVHPLLGRKRPGAVAGEWMFENTLRAQDNWVLDEHRIAGTAVLPGTAYIELAFAAFAACTASHSAEISDLTLMAPLVVADADACELQVVLTPRGEGYSLTVRTLDARTRDAWTEHARADIAALHESESIDATDDFLDGAPLADAGSHLGNGHGTGDAGMRFGGRWRAFESVAAGHGRGSACLRLPEQYRGDLDDYLLHPALLDCAVSFLIPALLQTQTEPYVPLHYRRVRIRRPGRFPEALFAHARSDQALVRDGGALTLDARIVDGSGAVWVEVGGMTARKSAMAPSTASAPSQRPQPQAPANFLLDTGTVGELSALRFVARDLPALGPHDVEVDIHAAALNFKDVLVALGMVPPPSPKGKFGLEFAGVVARCGSEVGTLQVGDEVMGFGGPWVAPRAVYPAAWLRRRPARLSVAEAAAAPVAFTIAQLALREIGGLRSGESVLIHSATGGVGLAAVQVAQQIGANIHASAGSPAKRAFLLGLGVQHVYDSRSPAFAREILERTAGGVDAVLNSLGLQLGRASLDVLRPQGRFLELGLGNDELEPIAQVQGKHFLPIVVDTADPGLERAWSKTVEQLAQGHWTALPIRSFPIDRIVEAFDYMAAARHIGKIVLTYDGWERLGLTQTAPPPDARQSEGDFFDQLLRGMSSRDGTDVFDRILHQDFCRVAVSTEPLQPLIERARMAARVGVGAFLAGQNLSVETRARPELAIPLQAPGNDVQSRLAQIWKDLLGLREVGIHDDFFDLGGDSLLAIRLLSRCREEFQVDQTLAGLLDCPTIDQLAQRIEQLQAARPRVDDAHDETVVI
ncbi:SDR family oxidoreductase [Xanthomonas arboricola]|uniref:SDR family oxidoreductase n=1 Tax=Xanthomonas arboricola TaxID=56448 RepID=UPI000C8541E7|nr:SDR family oxidoreductase [Xanthomonas arboricola]SOU07494.1 polyketide non-ribosomal peptide synthase [Xanthomonas arboricola pv. fragariae]